jgi:hypothetical protein
MGDINQHTNANTQQPVSEPQFFTREDVEHIVRDTSIAEAELPMAITSALDTPPTEL